MRRSRKNLRVTASLKSTTNQLDVSIAGRLDIYFIIILLFFIYFLMLFSSFFFFCFSVSSSFFFEYKMPQTQ
jgi:hypothetical protein